MIQCPPPPDPLPVWVSPCPDGESVCQLPDLDQDGIVGINDFLTLLSYWGETTCETRWRGDITMNGVVDVTDLLILLDAWGNYDPATWDRCDCGYSKETT